MEGAGALAPVRKARALIVIHYFPPHIGGMEEVAVAQAASLARRGHPVTVLTCGHARGLPRREESDGCTVRRIRAVNFIERRFGVTFPVIGVGGVLRVLREVRRADIVHVHDVFYPTSHATVLAARVLRRRYFMTQHVAMVEHPSRLVMAVQRFIYATVGAWALRRAERVVVYNAIVRGFVASLGVAGDRIVQNHNGIDTDRYAPAAETAAKAALRASYGLPPDRPVALFVGRLVPKKGFDLVMEAGCDEWTTLVVGDGAAAPLPPRPDVVLFGPADRQQLVDLYRLSDVFVFPAAGEIFTLVMQEAMASGLPVVTTDDPAYGEYGLDRSRIGFVERRPDAIRDAVRAVVTSPERAAAMGAYSRSVALERFSWERNYPTEYSVYPAVPPAGVAEPGTGEADLVANLAG